MVLKFLALFDIFLFDDWPFLHVRNLQENLLFSALILGLVFSCYVDFCWDKLFLDKPRMLHILQQKAGLCKI